MADKPQDIWNQNNNALNLPAELKINTPEQKFSPNGNHGPSTGLERHSPICPEGVSPISEIGVGPRAGHCGPKNPPKLPPRPRPASNSSNSAARTPSTSNPSSTTSLPSLQIGVSKRPSQPKKSLRQREAEAMDDLF